VEGILGQLEGIKHHGDREITSQIWDLSVSVVREIACDLRDQILAAGHDAYLYNMPFSAKRGHSDFPGLLLIFELLKHA
jgi:hypothetical protein